MFLLKLGTTKQLYSTGIVVQVRGLSLINFYDRLDVIETLKSRRFGFIT